MSKRQLEGAVETAPPGAAFDAAEPTLIGKVVLVTGASSGIGRAIAVACAAAGADVALTYRANRTGADETAQRVRSQGRRAELLPVDLTETRDLEALAALVRGALGRVDVWVNNAGADILTGAAARLSWVEKLDRLLAVDLRGTVLASWKAVELMRAQPPGGVILNLAWDHVLTGGMKGGYAEVFCAAKGGVYSFSRALAEHLGVPALHPPGEHVRRGVLRRQRRGVFVQPRARSFGGAPHPRERARAWLDRDGLRRRARPRGEATHRSVDPAGSLGHARGHRARGRVPRLRRRVLRHRANADDQRRGRHLGPRIRRLVWRRKSRPTTRPRSRKSCRTSRDGGTKTGGSAATTRRTAGPPR